MYRVLYSIHLGVQCLVSNTLTATFTYFFRSLPFAEQNILSVLNLYIVHVFNVAANLDIILQLWRLWITFFNLTIAIIVMSVQMAFVHTMLSLLMALTLVKLNLIQSSSRFDGVHSQEPNELAQLILKRILAFILPFDLAITTMYLVLQVPIEDSITQFFAPSSGQAHRVLGLVNIVNFFYVAATLCTLAYVQVRIRRRCLSAKGSQAAAAVVNHENVVPAPAAEESNNNQGISLMAIFFIACIGFTMVLLSVFSEVEFDEEEIPTQLVMTPIASNLTQFVLAYSPKLVTFLKLRYSQDRLPVITAISSRCRRRNAD